MRKVPADPMSESWDADVDAMGRCEKCALAVVVYGLAAIDICAEVVQRAKRVIAPVSAALLKRPTP